MLRNLILITKIYLYIKFSSILFNIILFDIKSVYAFNSEHLIVFIACFMLCYYVWDYAFNVLLFDLFSSYKNRSHHFAFFKNFNIVKLSQFKIVSLFLLCFIPSVVSMEVDAVAPLNPIVVDLVAQALAAAAVTYAGKLFDDNILKRGKSLASMVESMSKAFKNQGGVSLSGVNRSEYNVWVDFINQIIEMYLPSYMDIPFIDKEITDADVIVYNFLLTVTTSQALLTVKNSQKKGGRFVLNLLKLYDPSTDINSRDDFIALLYSIQMKRYSDPRITLNKVLEIFNRMMSTDSNDKLPSNTLLSLLLRCVDPTDYAATVLSLRHMKDELTITVIIAEITQHYLLLMRDQSYQKLSNKALSSNGDVAYFSNSTSSGTFGGRIKYGPCGICQSEWHDTDHHKKRKHESVSTDSDSKLVKTFNNLKLNGASKGKGKGKARNDKGSKKFAGTACTLCTSAGRKGDGHNIAMCHFNSASASGKHCFKCDTWGHLPKTCKSKTANLIENLFPISESESDDDGEEDKKE